MNLNCYASILEWWRYAKDQLKSYFMRTSKVISQEKYGTLNLLKSILRIKYENHSVSCNNFEEINMLKTRIKMLEDEICEGVKIRARVDERINGEKMSCFLLGKEKNTMSVIAKLQTIDGTYITDAKAIESHIFEYYKELYKKEEGDCRLQETYLGLLDNVIGKEENEKLTGQVTESEVWAAVCAMKNGKCPGLDGLSVEFYKNMWKVIKQEFN